MRVLMVTPSFFPIVGGCETVVEQLTNNLNRLHVTTDVMTFNMQKKWFPNNKSETTEENGFKVFRVSGFNPINSIYSPFRKALSIKIIPTINFSKKFADYDIIHFHDDTDLSFPGFSYFRDGCKKPRLLHCHGLNYVYNRYSRNRLTGSLFRKVADVYLALSNNSKEMLLGLGIPEAKIEILPNAVDTRVFVPNYAKKLDNLILCVARITKSKGITTLLKALFHCDSPSKVILIGPVNDDAYFSEVQTLIKKINEQTVHNVTYLGRVSQEELLDCYQKATVFACPSNSEPFGIVNLEALACGTPVVASNVGGIPDVVADGVNGFLVPPDDPIALASSLDRLLKDEKLRKELGQEGRRNVENTFSWDAISQKLINIYEQLALTF